MFDTARKLDCWADEASWVAVAARILGELSRRHKCGVGRRAQGRPLIHQRSCNNRPSGKHVQR